MNDKPLKPWESNNPNRILPAPHGHTPKAASETHKRRNADDYRATPAAERPALLRRIVGAEYNHAYKGRTNVLDEVADGVSELAARGELDGDNLEVLLDAVKNELGARKAAAAMTNAAQKKVNLAKTSPVRLGGEQTMPRERSAQSLRDRIKPMPEETPEAAPVTGGPFGTKPEASDNIDTFLKDAPPADDKPKCLNDWALDPDKRNAFLERVEYSASLAGVDMAHSRAWALALLNVPDETQIATSASEALKVIRTALPKPEPAPEPAPLVALQSPEPKPILNEATVIIFACEPNKASHILTLAGGQRQYVNITIRQGADMADVERAVCQYQQLVTIPGVEAHQVVSQGNRPSQPVAPAPQPTAPAPQQTAPAPTAANMPADPRGNVPGTTINAPFAYVKRNDVNGKTEVELYPAKSDGTPGDFVMPGGYLKEKALALFPAAELAALQPGVLTPRAGILTAIVANKQSSKGYYYLNAQHITLS